MHNNKKYILNTLIILSLIFLNTNDTFSAEICPFQETPKYIENYLINVHKIVENTNKIVKEKDKSKNTWSRISKELRTISIIQGSLNKLFTWEWYEIDIEYTVQGGISEIPQQLKRDVDLLQKEATNIKLAKPSWWRIEVTWAEICKWVTNCNFISTDTFEAIEVIRLLKSSTNKIKEIIKNQANDYSFTSDEKIYLINPEQLLNTYSKENIKKCNLSESDNWEKWFFATILDWIKRITDLNNYSKNWMKDWKQAISLLYWNADSLEYRNKEREVLARELQRQWVWWNNASTILSNLDAYNNSKNWDFPFMQWKQGFFNSLQLQLDEFDQALENSFPWYLNWNPSSNIIATKDISNEIKKLKKIKLKTININSEYNRLKSLSITEEINADKLLNKMIDMHISISTMINLLNKTCPISVKVCNSQKRWQWSCGQCN